MVRSLRNYAQREKNSLAYGMTSVKGEPQLFRLLDARRVEVAILHQIHLEAVRSTRTKDFHLW
jgi:hypothetical protein